MTQQPEPATAPVPKSGDSGGETGGRAEAPAAASGEATVEVGTGRTHEWPLVLVLLVAAAGLLVVALVDFRGGTVVLGAACLLAGVLRAVLRGRTAGLLAVRSRWVDVVLMLALGAGLVTLALSVPLIRR